MDQGARDLFCVGVGGGEGCLSEAQGKFLDDDTLLHDAVMELCICQNPQKLAELKANLKVFKF